MKLLIVRHGQSEANTRGVVAGSLEDSPLTFQGIADAQTTAANLQGRHIDLIMSSPLIRARRTAEIIRDTIAPQAGIEINLDFTERSVGDATGLPLAEYFALEASGQAIKNAEPVDAFYARIKRGLDNLSRHDGTLLLVTHNGAHRMIECVVQELPPEAFKTLPGLANGQLKELELEHKNRA